MLGVLDVPNFLTSLGGSAFSKSGFCAEKVLCRHDMACTHRDLGVQQVCPVRGSHARDAHAHTCTSRAARGWGCFVVLLIVTDL